jgi:hypothetical protein
MIIDWLAISLWHFVGIQLCVAERLCVWDFDNEEIRRINSILQKSQTQRPLPKRRVRKGIHTKNRKEYS